MTGYDFHPEARFDLAEIWEFIRAGNIDAADRMIAEILSAIRALVPFPSQGHRRLDHLTAFAFHSSARISDCLCGRRETIVGCGGDAWTPQPPRDGRNPEGPGRTIALQRAPQACLTEVSFNKAAIAPLSWTTARRRSPRIQECQPRRLIDHAG